MDWLQRFFRSVVVVGVAAVVLAPAGAGRTVAAGPAAPAQPATPAGVLPGEFFVHTATAGNVSADATAIDHPQLNNNPAAVFLATQTLNPNGAEAGVNNLSEIGAYYNPGINRWSVYNENNTNMPEGAAFNIYLPPGGSATHVHTSTVGSIANNWTNIHHVSLNGDPAALVFTLHNYNAFDVGGEIFNYHLGVWYSHTDQWAIFTQAPYTMTAGLRFNVFFRDAGFNAYTHAARAENVMGASTYLNHPLANGRPNAIILVTQNYEPHHIYNNKTVGVRYDVTAARWAIYNKDGSAMPLNASFNVLIDGTAVFLPLALR